MSRNSKENYMKKILKKYRIHILAEIRETKGNVFYGRLKR